MTKQFIFIFCLIPVILCAQTTPTLLPHNNKVKDTARQTDLIDIGKKLFHIKPGSKRQTDSGRNVYYSVLPIGASVPGGTGRALITSTTAGMYLGPRHTTNISSATFAPYWNFKGRFGLPLRNSIWLSGNSWNIQGDMRFLVYPQYTWGLGNTTNYNRRALIDYNYFRFYQSALKRITSWLYAGAGYNLDYRFNISPEEAGVDLKTFTGYSTGLQHHSVSSGVSLNLLYDTRNNSINPLPGAYGNLVYRVNPQMLGSNSNWQSLYIDMRKYVPLNKAQPNQQNMIAFWTYYWTAMGNAPYLDLPSTGWDPYNRSARGIDQNRYRGKSLYYFETEYRRDISRNGLFGFVVFTNINTVSGTGDFFKAWHPAAGTGLRIKFNKGSNTNIGLDYGFSKGYQTIMVNLGEAF